MKATALILLMLSAGPGCGSSRPAGPDVAFIIPGVAGGSGYGGLSRCLVRQGRSVQIVPWGAPPPLFFLNFSTKSIHDRAERSLAARIERWRCAHPRGRIDLIGHSAGGGVALGAAARLTDARLNTVILLAPSVSPGYDLGPALARVDGVMHVFFSPRDSLFLDWRTRNFGTYDRVKTSASGYMGFAGTDAEGIIIQHPYDERWSALGNDGGHFGTLSRRFAAKVIAPLLAP